MNCCSGVLELYITYAGANRLCPVVIYIHRKHQNDMRNVVTLNLIMHVRDCVTHPEQEVAEIEQFLR